MRGLVLFLVVLAVIASVSFVSLNFVDSNTNNEPKQEIKSLEFKTFTSAVCANDGKATRCKDELFVNCNGEISKVNEIAECNGLKLDLQKPTGSAVFSSNWKDPRA